MVQQLGDCTLKAFNDKIDAQFLWTARNEIEDKWSYINAWDKGWIKQEKADDVNKEIKFIQ